MPFIHYESAYLSYIEFLKGIKLVSAINYIIGTVHIMIYINMPTDSSINTEPNICYNHRFFTIPLQECLLGSILSARKRMELHWVGTNYRATDFCVLFPLSTTNIILYVYYKEE